MILTIHFGVPWLIPKYQIAEACSRRSLESAWVSVFPNTDDPVNAATLPRDKKDLYRFREKQSTINWRHSKYSPSGHNGWRVTQVAGRIQAQASANMLPVCISTCINPQITHAFLQKCWVPKIEIMPWGKWRYAMGVLGSPVVRPYAKLPYLVQ